MGNRIAQCFQPKEPLVGKRDYQKVLTDHFGDKNSAFYYANTQDPTWDETKLTTFVQLFFKGLETLAPPCPVDPCAQLGSLENELLRYFKDMDRALEKKSHPKEFGKIFDHARSESAKNLGQETDVSGSFHHPGEDLEDPDLEEVHNHLIEQAVEIWTSGTFSDLDRFRAIAENLPVFRAMMGQRVKKERENKNYVQEAALQQSRMVMCQALRNTCRKLHNKIWSSCRPFVENIMMPTREGEEPLRGQAKQLQDEACISEFASLLGHCLSLPVTDDILDEREISFPPEVEVTSHNFVTEHDAWKRILVCNVNDFADVNSFQWFLTGFYMAHAEDHLVRTMLGSDNVPQRAKIVSSGGSPISILPPDSKTAGKSLTGGKTAGKEDTINEGEVVTVRSENEGRAEIRTGKGIGGTVSIENLEYNFEGMALFPNCDDVLKGFNTSVDKWVASLESFKNVERDPKTGKDPFLERQLDFCLQAAKEAGTRIFKSKVFSRSNPLGDKLTSMAVRMAVQLVVTFKVENGVAGFHWTEFGKKLIQVPGGDIKLKEIKALQSALDKMEDITERSFKEMMTSMNRIVYLMNEPTAVARSEPTAVARIYSELAAELSKASDQKATFVASFNPPQSSTPVFLGAFGDVEMKPLVQKLNTDFKINNVASHDGLVIKDQQYREMLTQLLNFKPKLVFIVRSQSGQTADPRDFEKLFLQHIALHMPFIGHIIWLTDLSVNNSEFASISNALSSYITNCTFINREGKPTQVQTSTLLGKKASLMLEESGGQVALNLQTMMQKAADQVTSRYQAATTLMSETKQLFVSHTQAYLVAKASKTKHTPEEFYHLAKDKRDAGLDFVAPEEGARPEVKLPHKSMLKLAPYLEEIFETVEKTRIQKVNELRTRAFLKSAVRTQIMDHAKQLGRKLYDSTVDKLLVSLICESLAVPRSTFLSLLEAHACATEADGSHSVIAASFLVRKNFVSMYVGGTVLGTAPLLDCMVSPQLVRETPDRVVSGAEFEARIKKTVTTMKAMIVRRAPIESSSITADDMGLRLDRVQDHLQGMFTDTEVMKTLMEEMIDLLHSALANANNGAAQAMLKARLQTKFWAAGRDAMLGVMREDLEKPLESLMQMLHPKIARTWTGASDHDPLLLMSVDAFFADKKKQVNLPGSATTKRVVLTKTKQKLELEVFLAKVFSLVNALSNPDPHQHAGTAAIPGLAKILEDGEDRSGGYWSPDKCHILKSRIGCAFMALRMLTLDDIKDDKEQGPPLSVPVGKDVLPSDQAAAQVKLPSVKPCFVGVESAGKSTLINKLVDPLGVSKGEQLLPTGAGMATQCVTIVKHGENDECYQVPDRGVTDTDRMFKAMVDSAHAAHNARLCKQQSLETMNLNIRITPYQTPVGETMQPHLIDVPGIKQDTELDSALALGVASCVVICVSDPHSFNESCTHHEMKRFKALYPVVGNRRIKFRTCCEMSVDKLCKSRFGQTLSYARTRLTTTIGYKTLAAPPPIMIAVTKPRNGCKHSKDPVTHLLL